MTDGPGLANNLKKPAVPLSAGPGSRRVIDRPADQFRGRVETAQVATRLNSLFS